jgi:hypothetical protein
MLKRLIISDTARALPILVLSYSILMMHFVFSRAFRDSLLGSHLDVAQLPNLTIIGTLLAITCSLTLSFFLRSDRRIQVIRLVYLLNAVVEGIFAFGYKNHPWMYSGYFIEVAASTTLGLSLIWILIGDWTSRCNASEPNRVPTILICGTSAGMFAGFGLVHLPAAADFASANLLLAAMNLCVAFTLLFYSDGECVQRKESPLKVLAKGRKHWANSLVLTLVAVTVIGAAASTLLDLVFRVKVAEQYTDQSARLDFLGIFQGLICLGALLSQFGIAKLMTMKRAQSMIQIHPLLLAAGSAATAFAPAFGTMVVLRIAEYSARNSAFRCGVEITYAALPDTLRVEVRPLIDVVGERVGDIVAAGALELLMLGGVRLSYRISLITITLVSLVLLRVARTLVHRTRELEIASEEALNTSDDVSLEGIAREGTALG